MSLFCLDLNVNYFMINVKLKLVRSLECHFAIVLVFFVQLPFRPVLQLMQLLQLLEQPFTLFSILRPVIVSSFSRAQFAVISGPPYLVVIAVAFVSVFHLLEHHKKPFTAKQLELLVMVVLEVHYNFNLPFFVI